MVSVIVPIYCVEAYLPRCIESICRQSYPDLEIILVDDGSPDACGRICDDYAKKDSRISVIHKANGGLSDARNAGLFAAHGEWICFIDSDDYIDADMLERLYKRCRDEQSYIAVCDIEYVDEHGESIPELNRIVVVEDEVLTAKQALDKLCGEKNWYYVMVQNKLFRRKLFADISFPRGKLHEDEFVMYRLFAKSRRVSCVKGRLCHYTQRSDSITGRPYSVERLDGVEAYLEQVNFFLRMGRGRHTLYALNVAEYWLRTGREKLDMSLPENYCRYQELDRQLSETKRKLPVFLRIAPWISRKAVRLSSGIRKFLRK